MTYKLRYVCEECTCFELIAVNWIKKEDFKWVELFRIASSLEESKFPRQARQKDFQLLIYINQHHLKLTILCPLSFITINNLQELFNRLL